MDPNPNTTPPTDPSSTPPAAPALTPETSEAPPQSQPAQPVVQAHDGQQFTPSFSLFGPSFEALKINLGTILGLIFSPIVLLIPFFVLLVAMSGGDSDSPGATISVVLLFLVFAAVSIILSPAMIASQLASAKGERLSFGQALKTGVRYALPFLGLSFLVGFLTAVGFLLLIVPGVFLMQRWLLAPYYLVDGKAGVFESMRLSMQDAKRFSGPIWGLLGVTLLISVICAIPFIGWLPGIIMAIMYYCAPAIRYLEVKKATISDQTV